MAKENLRHELKALLDSLPVLDTTEGRRKVCREIWEIFKKIKTPDAGGAVVIKEVPSLSSKEKDELTQELNRLKCVNQGLEFRVNQVAGLSSEIARLRQDLRQKIIAMQGLTERLFMRGGQKPVIDVRKVYHQGFLSGIFAVLANVEATDDEIVASIEQLFASMIVAGFGEKSGHAFFEETVAQAIRLLLANPEPEIVALGKRLQRLLTEEDGAIAQRIKTSTSLGTGENENNRPDPPR